MSQRYAVLVTIWLLIGLAAPAQADVFYTVFNPSRNFTLFTYDSPAFITTITDVDVAQLAFANPLNPITGVDFIPNSLTYPGTSEIDLLQAGAATQYRFYPAATFTMTGVTPGDANSFGGSASQLSVAVPEPSVATLFASALAGLWLVSAPFSSQRKRPGTSVKH